MKSGIKTLKTLKITILKMEFFHLNTKIFSGDGQIRKEKAKEKIYWKIDRVKKLESLDSWKWAPKKESWERYYEKL